ncbi:MAG: hypothetical protein WBO24_04205 [Nitrospirales bacterium]
MIRECQTATRFIDFTRSSVGSAFFPMVDDELRFSDFRYHHSNDHQAPPSKKLTKKGVITLSLTH